VIFQVGTNGTGYAILYQFGSSASDGWGPYGSLILSGSTLYGMTYYGGTNEHGVIFQVGTNGTGYAILHQFESSASDGEYPEGSLTLSGSTLYGMTSTGGTGQGVIFQIGTNGAGYAILHQFGSSASDGAVPNGDLTLSGSILYGMTVFGGTNAYGVIFQVGTNGTGYTTLYQFGSSASDGEYPRGSLTLSGSTLYGMTSFGGTNGVGVIFSLRPEVSLSVTKLQAKVNLNPAKTNIDTCSLTVSLALEADFSVTNQPVTVDIGGAQASFTLNAKGRGVTSGDTCKLSYAKKTEVWTLAASMKKGSWATPWAEYGVTNATTPKEGVSVTLPVSVVIGTNTFATEETLNYMAIADKSGTLK